MTREDCRLCRFVIKPFLEGQQPEKVCDQVLFETANFVVVPSVGHFLPGWLLLVSKDHSTCAAQMPIENVSELGKLKESIRRILETSFGRTIFFEHGSTSECSRAGSCVMHTHLHAVPSHSRLMSELSRHFDPRHLANYCDIITHCENATGYIYYEDGINEIAAEAGVIPSQYFRQLIATEHQVPQHWDWRLHPFEEHVHETIEKLRGRTLEMTDAERKDRFS